MNLDDYVSVLKRQLPKYKQIKLPTVDEETAKKILAKLIAQGMTVEFKDGYFVLKESKNAQTTPSTTQTAQSTPSGANQESQPQPVTPKTTTQPQQANEQTHESNTIVLGNTVRVCVRLRQGLVDALHTIYNEPSTSNAIRKAVLEVIQSRGYKIVDKEEDDVIDVDEILGETNG
jgi:glucose/arabinose dehydrogenase